MPKKPKTEPYKDWQLRDEVLVLQFLTFDIKKAKQILLDKPRRPVVADISTWFSLVSIDKNKTILGISVDIDKIKTDLEIDISVPLIECIIESPKPYRFLIDGWHRVAKAKYLNSIEPDVTKHINRLPLVVLTEKETRSITK